MAACDFERSDGLPVTSRSTGDMRTLRKLHLPETGSTAHPAAARARLRGAEGGGRKHVKTD